MNVGGLTTIMYKQNIIFYYARVVGFLSFPSFDKRRKFRQLINTLLYFTKGSPQNHGSWNFVYVKVVGWLVA